MNHFDVAIIGMGPAGSMAALLLESYGMRVLCIDKEKDIYSLPRAVTVSDQGFRMSQLAGIDDIYLKNSTILGGAYFSDKDLEIIGGSIDLKGFVSANGWPASSLFHQPYTDRDIRKKLENSNVRFSRKTRGRRVTDKERPTWIQRSFGLLWIRRTKKH